MQALLGHSVEDLLQQRKSAALAREVDHVVRGLVALVEQDSTELENALDTPDDVSSRLRRFGLVDAAQLHVGDVVHLEQLAQRVVRVDRGRGTEGRRRLPSRLAAQAVVVVSRAPGCRFARCTCG